MTGQVGNVPWLEQRLREHSPVPSGSLKSGPAGETLGVLPGEDLICGVRRVRRAAGQGHPAKA